MFDFLEKIRQKPERTKKQIAFFTAFSVVLIMFVVWVSVIFPNWKDSESRNAKASSLEPSPTNALLKTFEEGFAGISEQFNKIKDSMSSFSTQVEHYTATTTEASTTNTISQ